MLKAAGTLDIDVLGRINEHFASLWRRQTPVLPDWEHLVTDPFDHRFIARKRRRCTLLGHIWEMTNLERSTNTYTIECSRCFPHIDSRRTIVSYNPFSTVEGTD